MTCCGIQSNQAQFTVHVATSVLLSRQNSCRDVYLMSRRRLEVLCSLQLIACDVATSWPYRDIHYSSLQSSIVVPDVATSVFCRDMDSSLLHPSTGCHDVATSVFLSRHQSTELQPSTGFIWCRDIDLLSRPHFMPL